MGCAPRFPGAEITVGSRARTWRLSSAATPSSGSNGFAALRRSGALTDEEFAAAKAGLLG